MYDQTNAIVYLVRPKPRDCIANEMMMMMEMKKGKNVSSQSTQIGETTMKEWGNEMRNDMYIIQTTMCNLVLLLSVFVLVTIYMRH